MIHKIISKEQKILNDLLPVLLWISYDIQKQPACLNGKTIISYLIFFREKNVLKIFPKKVGKLTVVVGKVCVH